MCRGGGGYLYSLVHKHPGYEFRLKMKKNDASHCVKGRSSLKTQLNPPWVLTVDQNEYNHFFGSC